jgi:hypothetical protein
LNNRILQVQAAQHAVAGTRHVVLDKRPGDARFGIALRLKAFEEKAALITQQLGFQNEDFREIGRNHLHDIPMS